MELELSIIVPVFNVEQYLEECLNSIYKIKNIRYEVILVNDGSTDSSLEILRRYVEQYPDITVLIDKENGGLSSARNEGIKVSKGEYISFIDSDDWIDSKNYEKFFKKGQKFNLDIMISKPILYQNNKTIYNGARRIYNTLEIVSGHEFLINSLEKKCYNMEVWDDIYKRDLLVKNKLYFIKGILHEDEVFTPFALKNAKKVKLLEWDFYFYRQREGSITKTKKLKNRRDLMYIANKLLNTELVKDKIFQNSYLAIYRDSFLWTRELYVKDCLYLIFKLSFLNKIRLLKTLLKSKEIKWSIENAY